MLCNTQSTVSIRHGYDQLLVLYEETSPVLCLQRLACTSISGFDNHYSHSQNRPFTDIVGTTPNNCILVIILLILSVIMSYVLLYFLNVSVGLEFVTAND